MQPIEYSLSFTSFPNWTLCCFRLREDNTGSLLYTPDGRALAVDVPEAAPMLDLLSQMNLRLEAVWITHGHRDHVDGLAEVADATGCRVRAHPDLNLPGAVPLIPGMPLAFADATFRVIDTSAHSLMDLSFYAPDLGLCFCGDTLFPGGCGRLFAGTPAQMWDALLQLRALPDRTLMVCGHDYTLDNLTFAVQNFPNIPVFAERLAVVQEQHRQGKFQGVTTMDIETRSNPMLMADHPAVAAALGMAGEAPLDVFIRIREMRNQF